MSDVSERIAYLSPQEKRVLLAELLQRGAGETRSVYPLSYPQRGLWLLDQLAPASPAYNIPGAVRLTGLLHVAALEQSLNEMIRRHETLRTTFATVEGRPVQVIAQALTVPLPVVDLEGLAEREREAEVQRWATEEAQRPFDLARGPLVRTTLLRLRRDEHVLLLSMHHIVSDGWSMGVLVWEVAALYEAFSSDQPSPLPDLPIQYADFAHWQRQRLQGEVLEEQLAYWQQQLHGAPPVLALPTNRPRPTVQTFRGAHQALTLPKALAAALKTLSLQEGVTLFMTLLAAFQTLLHRYTGQEDLVVGSPIANRTRAEIEGLIGFFVNMLPLRTDLSGDPSFRTLLARVREVCLGAYAHQDLPFEKLVEALQPERDLSRTPLFQVMFVLQNAPMPPLELPALTLSLLHVDSRTAKFDLTLSLEDKPEGLSGFFEYNTDLFDATTITRMAGHLETVLAGIVADPDLCVSTVPLLTDAERHQLLVEWNATQAEYPKASCLHELVEAQVEKTPDAVAVVFEDDHLTYRELNHRANQLAHYLRALGVGPDVLVGICVERSVEMVVGLLGILKAGGAYVPLDPTYPKERLAFMLQDAQVPVLLTQQRLRQSLPEHGAREVCLDTGWGAIAKESGENPVSGATADNLAYVIYTSGSAGKPKGVLIDHSNVVRLFTATHAWFQFDQHDVWTLFHSYAYDFSVWEMWGALIYGGRLVVVPYRVTRAPAAFYELLCRERVTVLDQTPSAFYQLMRAVEESGVEALDGLGEFALRLIIFGGEALEPRRLEHWFARHGDKQPQLVNMYGITETTVHVTYRPLTATDVVNLHGSPIGHPLPDLQLYLLDRHLQPVPIGVFGEIYVGGAGLARGYLNRPELTAERFIANPFSGEPGARLYKTGDLARYLPDGDLEFLGRLDHQVKIRGFRIELGEIEAVLRQHRAVRETVVLAREDVPGDKRLVAYVVPTQEPAPTVSDLRDFLRGKLPHFMVPAAFVTLDTLPLTPNGKVDRRALPPPDTGRPELERAFVAPRTPVEELLAGSWADVLKLERIGVHDNFFELGGHSLLAIQVISRLNDTFRVEMPPSRLFEAPTVAGLADHIEAARRGEEGRQASDVLARSHGDRSSLFLDSSVVVPIQPAGFKPPFVCVAPAGGVVYPYYDLACQLGREQPFYALRDPCLAGSGEPYTRVEEYAAHYCGALREVQPEGPYLLGGWSFGGLVAFELALQLQREGEQVAFLALFDMPAPAAGRRESLGQALASWKNRLLDSLAVARGLVPIGLDGGYLAAVHLKRRQERAAEPLSVPEHIRLIWLDALRRSFLKQTGMAGILARDPGLLRLGLPTTSLRRVLRNFRANTRTGRHYVPQQAFAGRITLFRAREQGSGRRGDQDSTLGWGDYAARGVEVHEIPGNHMVLFMRPFVQTLAGELRVCIERAQADITNGDHGRV